MEKFFTFLLSTFTINVIFFNILAVFKQFALKANKRPINKFIYPNGF